MDYQVLDGRTAEAAVWPKLTALLQTEYPTESGAKLQIVKFAIDSGYATPEVYDWRGSTADSARSWSRAMHAHPLPLASRPPSRSDRMVRACAGAADDSADPYPPGYCHFPKYGEEYFKQLTAEELVTRIVKGYRRPEWQKTRERNEALD